jgi:23S rRNA 5-hydroxycytidine C2501 synthase
MASASHGRCAYTFTPDPARSFNRSSTDYFVNGRQGDIGAFDTPVHAGLAVARVTRVANGAIDVETLDEHDELDVAPGEIKLSTAAKQPDDRHEVRASKFVDTSSTKEIHATFANGDGLTYFNGRELQGLQVNIAKRVGMHGHAWRLEPNAKLSELSGLKVGTILHRNRDHAWEQTLARASSERRIAVTMKLTETNDGFALEVNDGYGNVGCATISNDKELAKDAAKAEASLRENLSKLGNTLYAVQPKDIELTWSKISFVPASLANALRREAIAALDDARATSFVKWERSEATQPLKPYPSESLSYLANVYNEAARAFYAKHGVKMMDAAYEMHQEAGEVPLMVTKHCLRFAFNLCPKQAKGVQGVQGQIRAEPMTLISSGEKLTLKFDCKPCEMHVMGTIRPHILKSPPPSIASVSALPASGAPIKFFSKKTVTID